MTADKVLDVWLNAEMVGHLVQTPTGKMQFTYAPTASRPLSLGMPLCEEPYGEVQTEAYFGGLLPESEVARIAIGKRYGVNHHNSFALLKAIGYDCAGAVSLHPSGKPIDPPPAEWFPLQGKVLAEASLHQHIQDLPRKPLFIGVDGLRLSLAGAQDKAAVCLIDNQIALPKAGCPTTHILKPMIPQFDGIVHNEYLCLKVAHRLGIQVPRVEIRWAKDIPYLLIERYDRAITNNQVRRIHQEDFCQALGVNAADKYQREGGPGLTTCFNLLRNTTQPVKNRNRLASLIVFNFLIGNMDAHGKNFSLLHTASNHVELAPAYDLTCTRVYDELTGKMAMKIGGYYEPEKILPRHWERQCDEMGYAYPALREILQKQADKLLEAFQTEKSLLQNNNLFHPIADEINHFIEQHLQKLIKRY